MINKEKMLIECSKCNITIEGIVVGHYANTCYEDPTDGENFSLVKCPQCLQPVLMKSILDLSIDGWVWNTPVKIYPTNEFHVNPIVPDALKNALIESIKCYKSGSYTATAIMCRRSIEGFCSLKDVKETDLAKSLAKLKEKGIINEQLYEWANLLRITGNEAAHNIDKNFSSLDAKDILDFTIAILDFSYSFKDKFEKFSKRQKE